MTRTSTFLSKEKPMSRATVLILAAIVLATQSACAIHAALTMPGPANDEAVGVGMHRRGVETVLDAAPTSQYEEDGWVTVRYEYADGPPQASKVRSLLYAGGDFFTIFLSEIIFWPIELYAKERIQRVGMAKYNKENVLVEWTIQRPGGETLEHQVASEPPGTTAWSWEPSVASAPPAASSATASPASWTGTCFAITEDGLVLTAHHLIEGMDSIEVELADGRRVKASIDGLSRAADLALLHLDAATAEHLTIGSADPPKMGERVFTIGFPETVHPGFDPKFSEGSVTAPTGPGGDSTFFQIDVPLQPGNSGGPLVNDRGELVGIVTATVAGGTVVEATATLSQDANWAVNADYALPLVGRTQSVPAAKNREDAVNRTRAAICRVEATRSQLQIPIPSVEETTPDS